jgi:hypothetical protein
VAWFAIRTVWSAVAEGMSDNSSYAPRINGSVPGRAPRRDRELLHEIESYNKGAINVDMDDLIRLNLLFIPRLEPDCERLCRMPRSSYESMRAEVLEMDAYFRH